MLRLPLLNYLMWTLFSLLFGVGLFHVCLFWSLTSWSNLERNLLPWHWGSKSYCTNTCKASLLTICLLLVSQRNSQRQIQRSLSFPTLKPITKPNITEAKNILVLETGMDWREWIFFSCNLIYHYLENNLNWFFNWQRT